MAKVSATDKILNKVRKDNRSAEPKSPIATGMYLPNHSGIAVHPEFINSTTFVKRAGDTMTGDLTMTTLTASQFVRTDANKKLESFDLFSAANIWSGAQTFIDITPLINSAYDLGRNSFRWKELFVDDITTTNDVSGGTIGGITEANLLDKTAAETISGTYDFTRLDIGPYEFTHSAFNGTTSLFVTEPSATSSANITFRATSSDFNMIIEGDLRVDGEAKGQVVAFMYNQASAGTANQNMRWGNVAVVGSSGDGLPMPRPGSIISHATMTNVTSAVSGDVTFNIEIDNTLISALQNEFPFGDGTGATNHFANIARDTAGATFTAGQVLSARAIETGDMAWDDTVGMILVQFDT